MPPEPSIPVQAALLQALGIDVSHVVKAVLTLEVCRVPTLVLTRHLVVDDEMVERVQALELRCEADDGGIAAVSPGIASPSMSTGGGN